MIKVNRLLILCFITGCSYFTGPKPESVNLPDSGRAQDTLNYALIEFEDTEHHFGRVYEGEQVGWFFKFKNSGYRDLIILNAYSSCGCTIPDYNKSPIRPGKEGMIRVAFDSNGRSGIQTKTITIESNAKNRIVTLSVTAEIIKRKV